MPGDPHGRQDLAAKQRQLVEALTGAAPAPDAFDPAQIETAATALADKRMRSARKAWPVLADVLGERFEPLFRAYAARYPSPPEGPGVDAATFLRQISAGDHLARDERYKLLPLRARRGWPIRFLIAPPSVALAVRFAGRRVRVFTLWPRSG